MQIKSAGEIFEVLDLPSAIHEDAKSGMYVEGLQEVVVSTAEATYGVFRRGSENRHVGMTAMNAESSRSHSVFTVVVESQVCASITSSSFESLGFYF